MYDAVLSRLYRKSCQGQVKNGQVLNLINANQKGITQMQFDFRNPMVSFVLLYNVYNWQTQNNIL